MELQIPFAMGTLPAAAGCHGGWMWVHTESIPTRRAYTEYIAKYTSVDAVDTICTGRWKT